MFAVIEWLSHGFAAYRITQDAGMWIWTLTTEATQNYMEMYLVSKGMLP